MPRLLISISSCESFELSGLNDPMRKTWLPEAINLGFDVKFFHGSGATPKDDVVVLPVEDALFGLTEKAKAKAKWAFDQGYDWVFSCFPDTYASPERLLRCGFETCDYLGNVHQFPGYPLFCQGGPGVFLSRRACGFVYSSPHSYLNDDAFVGDTLAAAGIIPKDHRGFTAFGPGPLKSNASISVHLSTQPGGYTGDNMYVAHENWLRSWL